MAVVLITGPVRSGKSAFAQRIARECGRAVTYVATAAREQGDAAWDARIDHHRDERPAHWRTVETAALTASDVQSIFTGATADDAVLVDALGTWLAARIAADIDAFERDPHAVEARLDDEAAQLANAMNESPALVIVVGEQVGWDVVPVTASARVFRDVLGRMEQRIGAFAERAYLVVAGFALDLRAGERVR